MCVRVRWASSDLPDPSEDAVQILLHLHKGAGVEKEALVHLLQSHVGQPVEVDQHFICFLKAIKPVFRKIQQSKSKSRSQFTMNMAGESITVTCKILQLGCTHFIFSRARKK